RVRALVDVLRWNIVFFQGAAIEVDLAAIDADPVSGQADHTLDIALRGVPRITEDHNVAALDRLPSIYELVDENALLVIEGRHHAGAFDFHRLVEEDDDEGRDGQGNDEVAHPDGQHGQAPGLGHGSRLRLCWWDPHNLHIVLILSGRGKKL